MSTISRIPTPKSLYDQWITDQGLTPKDIAVMGLRLCTPDEVAPLLGYYAGAPCILIPYEPAGTPEYIRVRRLGVTDNKYMGPKGSKCSPLYLAPSFDGDWEDVKVDPNHPLGIAEGEVKSYIACKMGMTVVGIGGVQMQDTLFDGSWIWKDRSVQVIFDHDIGQVPGGYKREVFNALGRLCTTLIEHGAKVHVLHIGKAVDDPSKKYGLDDYLREYGTAGLPRLAETAGPAPEWCAALADMLDTCVYVVGTNHVHVYNLLNRSRKSPSDFHDTHIEKKRWDAGADGKPRVKQISKIWIEHPGRVTVSNYGLDPRLPFGVQGDLINLWEGYPTFPRGSMDKTAYVREEWQKFMEGLFGEHWKWVALWAGHMLNRPWERCTQAVMLVTMVQGIGKSLFGDVLRDLTGKHGLEGKASRMFGNFNSEQEAKAFVMVNELDVKFSAKEGQLNDLLTEEVVTIEQKGKDVIELPNLRRWYLTTNTSSPCRLSRGQRRVLVINPPRVVGDTRGEWGLWVGKVVAGFRRDGEALAAIRGWFDDIWYTSGLGDGVWDSTLPVPETEAGRDAAEASMTVTQILAEHMYEWICSVGGGIGVAHPDLRKRDVKAFGDLTALVKAHGGFVGQKTVKEDGMVKTYTVWDASGRLQRTVKPSSGNATVEISSDDAKAGAVALAAEYVKMTEILTGKG